MYANVWIFHGLIKRVNVGSFSPREMHVFSGSFTSNKGQNIYLNNRTYFSICIYNFTHLNCSCHIEVQQLTITVLYNKGVRVICMHAGRAAVLLRGEERVWSVQQWFHKQWRNTVQTNRYNLHVSLDVSWYNSKLISWSLPLFSIQTAK